MKFLQNSHDTAHLTISMLLHYLGKLKKNHFFLQILKKKQTNCIF